MSTASLPRCLGGTRRKARDFLEEDYEDAKEDKSNGSSIVAERCSICGKRMGVIGGLRGFGWMEKSHETRCRMQMVRLAAKIIDTTVKGMAQPQRQRSLKDPKAKKGEEATVEVFEAQFHLRPSVGTWLMNAPYSIDTPALGGEYTADLHLRLASTA